NKKGQPVLVGTVTIEKSEILSSILKKNGIKHEVLNAKYHEKEAEIIAQAGKYGAVTISTNMAGRGTDIMLGGNAEFLAKKKLRDEGYDDSMIYEATSFGETDNQEIIDVRAKFKEYNDLFQKEIDVEAEKVRNAGGLFILGTERHESRRIDNQLRGRAGRQGDPGETRFFISLEDDLMRLFGGDRLIGIVNKLNIDEDQAIDAKLVSNSIETAQKRLEGTNFERRKHVLEYDDVMNQQREIIYGQRRSVLDDSDMTDKIKNMIYDSISSTLDFYASSEIPDEWNFDGIKSQFRGIIISDDDLNYSYEELNSLTREKLEKILVEKADKRFAEQEEVFTPEIFKEAQRAILLRVVDKHWVEHIDAMDDLISGINLHAFAQRSPINEYKIQGAEMFDAMISSIREETVRIVLTAKPVQKVERKQVMTAANVGLKGQVPEKKVVVTKTSSKKVGPNDACPCGSGKKYKKCCGAVGSKTEE
ncbi:MAG: SEC-C domain-containing protein, partial [Clostridia bacterium]|nr:SEC-C domain-containing protein [Clostridia bacterium]